jgi:hypothetical protein
MAKLGYTWYPNDWASSESVFELNLSERGLYRELIDLAMKEDNSVVVKLNVWSRKFGADEQFLNDILNKIRDLKLIEIKDNILSIPSCEPRLKLIRGGKLGGQKSTKNKPTHKPTDKPIVSLSENNDKPTPKQRERERESKIKENKNIGGAKAPVIKKNIEDRKKEFAKEIAEFKNDYPRETLLNFFEYWTEKGPRCVKMRFEKESTFEISKRLVRWASNNFSNKSPSGGIIEAKGL